MGSTTQFWTKTGLSLEEVHQHQKQIVTYHANFATGKEMKKNSLKFARPDLLGWNVDKLPGQDTNKPPRPLPTATKSKPIERQGAVEVYVEKVKSDADRKKHCNEVPDALRMDIALSCLHKTTPSLTLEYPSDADAHTNEIRLVYGSLGNA
jgi:hypothetical protein